MSIKILIEDKRYIELEKLKFNNYFTLQFEAPVSLH